MLRVIVPPAGTEVLGVNTRTGETVEPATLDPTVSEVNAMPPTWPPRAPDATPTLAASLLVDTLIPVVLPPVAGPNVMPKRVTEMYMPACTATEVVKTTEDEPPNIVWKAPMEDAAAGGGPGTMKPMG